MTPFASMAQMRYMYKMHPKIAKRWTKEQEKEKGKKSFKRLPKRVKRKDSAEPIFESIVDVSKE